MMLKKEKAIDSTVKTFESKQSPDTNSDNASNIDLKRIEKRIIILFTHIRDATIAKIVSEITKIIIINITKYYNNDKKNI